MSKKRTSTDFSVIADDEREDGAWTDFVVWVSGKADVPRDTSATWRAFKAGWHACHVTRLVEENK